MIIHNTNHRVPYFALISLSALWGAGFYLTQLGLEYVGAFGFVALRCAATAMVPALFSLKTLRNLTRYEAYGGAAIAVLAVIGFGTCATALENESSARVAFLSSLYILMVPVAQFIFFKERSPMKLILGGILAFIGIGVLSGSFASRRLTLSAGAMGADVRHCHIFMFAFITDLIGNSGYFSIFLMVVLENTFQLIPSELIKPFAAYETTVCGLNLPLHSCSVNVSLR